MSLTPLPALLDEILHTVERRYRLPPLDSTLSPADAANPAATLAIVIEEARRMRSDGRTPDAALRQRFIDALARMIRDAMDTHAGDPAFQAAVLRHDAPSVREYASLSAHAEQDRRALHSAVNAIAHPAKLERSARPRQRDGPRGCMRPPPPRRGPTCTTRCCTCSPCPTWRPTPRSSRTSSS